MCLAFPLCSLLSLYISIVEEEVCSLRDADLQPVHLNTKKDSTTTLIQNSQVQAIIHKALLTLLLVKVPTTYTAVHCVDLTIVP